MRLIDADALYEKTAEWEAQALAQVERYNPTDSFEKWRRWSYVLKERSAFKFDVADAPIIVEYEGDINKVIVKGEEYHRIVRCKDCKHRYIENMTWHCPFGLMGGEDFFCGYGSLGRAERRSDDGV